MKPCLFGLFRPFLRQIKEDQDETDNYYSCVALRAATKKDINFAKDPDILSSYIRDCDLFPSIHLLLTCDTEEENNYDPQSCVADRSQLIMVNVQRDCLVV